MDDLMQPAELAIALRRIAKVSYGATIEEARSVSKTQRDAADLIEQQAARITALESERATLLHDVEIHAQEAIYAHAKVEAMEKGVEPVAWLVTSKRGLVRCAWTQKPSPDQLATCEVDGDIVTPLYDVPRSHPDMGRLDFLIEKEAYVYTNGIWWSVIQGPGDDPSCLAQGETAREAIDAALANQKQAG